MPKSPIPINKKSIVDKRRLSGPPKKIHLKRGSKILLLVIFGLTAIGAVPRLLQQHNLFSHKHAQLAQAVSVSVVAAKPGPSVEEFALPGTTQAIQDAPIYARVDGYLSKRYVNIGDKVRADEVLAEIDTPELDHQVQAAASAVEQAAANLDNSKQAYQKSITDDRSAAANVQKAKTDLDFFKRELARYNELAKEGAVSQEAKDSHLQAYNAGKASLDSLIAAEKSAQANINSARAAVYVAQAALDAAQFQHDQFAATRSFKTVKAPFDGIVTKRNVDAGALITSGSNSSNSLLFEVEKTNILRVFVFVPEQYIPYVRVAENARLNFQEYPGREFIGTVSNISGGVDPDSKTLQVEIHVPNKDNKLLPGMYVKVRFQSESPLRLPEIPSTTLQTRADGVFVYSVDSHQRIHMHKIEIGRDLGGKVEVEHGIQSGQQLVINPTDELQDGMKVTPVLAVLDKNEAKPEATHKPSK